MDRLVGVLLALSISPMAAWAQSADAGDAPMDPVRNAAPSNGDASVDVIRETDLPEEDGGTVDLPVDASDAGAPVAVTPAGKVDEKPSSSEWKLTANLAASFRFNYGGATLFPFDDQGTTSVIAPLQTRLRVSPEIRFGRIGLIAEADAATGAILGIPDDSLVSDRQPTPAIRPVELRKVYLEYKWSTGVLRVGQQTSQWGLGLLANDGGKDPEAGDFGQRNFGNLTYRALIAARPFFGLGGAWRGLETIVAGDLIVRDNLAEFSKGDRAFQAVVAARFVKDEDNNIGFYGVYRNQRNINVTDGGKATDAFILDIAGKWQLYKDTENDREFRAGFELVGITGTTTQARNENADLLKVSQLGFAMKAKYRMSWFSVLFDGGYASGDQNPSDDHIDNLRFDRDFKVGLILFDQVMAYQSGRSSVRASDPSLTGKPPEGVDLLGTGGSITGAWYLFPRIKLALADWMDVYGGPLFAFSTARLTDPYNSRIGGGTSINPLGGHSGLFLGTEVDVGMQIRFKPIEQLLFSLTGEGGIFAPGNAYKYADGGYMLPVAFGRIRITVAFN